MIIVGVKRLVHIDDEMKEKLRREQKLLRRRGWRFELDNKLLNLIDDAVIRRSCRRRCARG